MAEGTDTNILRIIATIRSATLYEFDPAAKIWHKQGIEGVLNIVERSTDPKYQLVIVTRTSRNFKQAIDATLKVQKSNETTWILKSADGVDYGIWSSYTDSLDETFETIQGLINQAVAAEKAETPVKIPRSARPVLKQEFSGVRFDSEDGEVEVVKNIMGKLKDDPTFLSFIAKHMRTQ